MSTEPMSMVRKCRGRPKQFDREHALCEALKLFWLHGYEATSLADLVAATGAKAPTLYGEFGNKEGLFRAAVEHYFSTFYQKSLAILQQDQLPIAQVVEQYLRALVTLFTDENNPTGCFMVGAPSGISPSSVHVGKMMRERHQAREQTLCEFLEKRQRKGELDASLCCEMLGKYLACTIQGMSIQARDGTCRQQLSQLVDITVQLWPHLIALSVRPE
jgi:AcrR family transcriptional regulator